jgi:hypothetical protein
MSETKSTPIQNHRQNYSLEYSNLLSFLTADEKTEGSGPNGSKHYQNSISSQFPPESNLNVKQ